MLKTIEVGFIKSDKDAISTLTSTSELNHELVHSGFVRDLVQPLSSKESSNRTLFVADRYRPCRAWHWLGFSGTDGRIGSTSRRPAGLRRCDKTQNWKNQN